MCCCLLRLGFCCCLQVFLSLADSQLSPAAAFLLGTAPSCPRTCGYKVILLQSKMGQEIIILPQPFLDGAQGICCCNSGLSCQAKPSGEVSTLAADQPGTAPKKLPHSYHQQNQLPVNYPRYFTPCGFHRQQPRKTRGGFAPLLGVFRDGRDAPGHVQCHGNEHCRAQRALPCAEWIQFHVCRASLTPKHQNIINKRL